MLEKIKKLIAAINAEFPGWLELIDENQDFSEKCAPELKNKFFELVFAIKELCIEQEKNVQEILKNEDLEKRMADVIEKHVNNSMIYYNMLQPIRNLSFQNQESAKEIIYDIFENYILRLDYEIYERYEYFNSEDENRVKRIFSAIDRLTDYYVERLLVKKEVKNDFSEETGISEEVCEYYAQLYEENFKELRLNLILNKLNDLEHRLNES